MVIGSKEVEDREEEDPHQIHEMPEEARNLDSIGKLFWMGFPHLASRAPEIGNHQRTRNHVQGVQPCQGKVNCEVGVGPWPPSGSFVNLLLKDLRSSA